MGASAGALFAGEDADILSAVAQERETFLVKGSEDKFTLGSFGEDFAGLGINDLRIEVVLIDVHSCLFLALEGDAGA